MIGLKNYYWYFKQALPQKICEDIIAVGNSYPPERGIIQGEKEGSISDASNIRKSQVTWLTDQWIYDEITPYINMANKNAGWNFDWNWSESIQFTNYEPGEFYSWHSDDSKEPFGDGAHPNYKGKIRKLSATVSLSDPNFYTGGDFELDLRNNQCGRNIITVDEVKEQGTIIVFPSFIDHQVREVRSGKRVSLVIWNLGPPWK